MENNDIGGQSKKAVGTSSEMLVGIFDSQLNARQAFQTMRNTGFPQDILQLCPDADVKADGHERNEVGKQDDSDQVARMVEQALEAVGAPIGSASPAAYMQSNQAYVDAVRQGHTLLIVAAHTDEQIGQAAAIMNRFKVLGFEERSMHREHQGWTGYHENAEANRLGSGNVSDGSSAVLLDPDEQDFRNHWRNAYGNASGRYEDYEAAYRYGASMGRCGGHQGTRLDELEQQLRSGWETGHPGASWENVREAVSYGAQRSYSKER